MYSIENLLHLVHSDGADGLRLHVGRPPIVVLDGEEEMIEGPEITTESAEELFHSLSTTRQRRVLWVQGEVEFAYRFRNRALFIVSARMELERLIVEIH